jgi:hypothetical protein
MNVTIQGSGGEAYTRFSKTQSDGKGEASLDPPWFKAVDASGKQVATGRFEFG